VHAFGANIYVMFICWMLFSNFICFDLAAYQHVALEVFNVQYLEDAIVEIE
jgi:hypothetical protein